MNLYKKILIILFVLAIISGLTYNYFIYSISPSTNSDKLIEFSIKENENLKDITKKLKSIGLIRDNFMFELFLRFNKIDKTIKAGEYSVQNIKNVNDLISLLQKGQDKLIKYTIPEGYNVKQIAETLSKENIVNSDEFINLAYKQGSKFKFKYNTEINNGDLEGFLFPETYFISKPNSEKVINQMLDQFALIFDSKMEKRAKEINMSIKDIITLASIIEKEAAIDSERAIVSSVFHNRLKEGMNLESCATVEYVVKKSSYLLTREDLKFDSPYNTYMYSGLPPAPICSPGLKSIIAALNPSKTDYLFFVAKGDGSHAFSKTYDEHLRNVQKYLP
jgi:UPF0755 protein